jgi:hypothetical protein
MVILTAVWLGGQSEMFVVAWLAVYLAVLWAAEKGFWMAVKLAV